MPWLLGILAMHARRQRERAGREIDLERVRQPEAADPERDAERGEIVSAVNSAVERLGANYAPLVRRHLLSSAPLTEFAPVPILTPESVDWTADAAPVALRVQ